MVKISITTVTARDLGMFPYQVELLKAQTFKDFEWVIMDDLWEQNKDKLKSLVGDSFPLKHILPKDIKPYFAPGHTYNDAFTYCSGELVFFMSDYILPHPDCLRRHWEVHQTYPKAFVSGRCWEVDIPAEQFMQPNKVFHYNDYRFSLFENSLFRWSFMKDGIYGSDKMGVQNFWTGRNDAAPMEAILECNGFDEDMDGAHGYHDEDLAQRMQIIGLNYLLDANSLCWQFAHIAGGRPQLRSDWEQHQMFKVKVIPERIEKGIYKVNPHRNLRKEREQCLKSQS